MILVGLGTYTVEGRAGVGVLVSNGDTPDVIENLLRYSVLIQVVQMLVCFCAIGLVELP
jgi:hypothetical protein